MSSTKVFTVKEINNYIKSIMENDFLLSHVHIKGEISNFKLHSSGHAYFTLKDTDSRLKCIMFKSSCMKLKFMPEDGMAVVVRGHFSIYERDGQYQLYADDMAPEGTGALYKAYEQLKKKLSQEGLFDNATKKKIPFLPRNVGVVTSPTGAAVRDIISIIRRRNSLINIILYPVQVQGEAAAGEIAQGIAYFNENKNVDVIIAGRGGGSIEELWAFNEEIVARAISSSSIPVVSAVGHETDFTIADFVADLRAATPSAAAELVTPELQNLLNRLNQSVYKLNSGISMFLQNNKHKVEYISRDNAFKKIEQRIITLTQTVDILSKELEEGMQQHIKDNKERLIKNIEKLDILNPAAALLRGYAYARSKKDNIIISTIANVCVNDDIEVELRDGKFTAQVKEIINK